MRIVDRAEQLKGMAPQLTADVFLYPKGGRKSKLLPGYGCPCMVSNKEPWVGWDGWLQLGDAPMELGETRRLGFVFLSGEEAAKIFREAQKFYLWEGRIIGEAIVVDSNASKNTS